MIIEPTLHLVHAPGFSEERDRQAALLVEQHGAVLHADAERRGVLPTFLDALEAGAADRTGWAVVIQDDAQPLRDWRMHLSMALSCSPAPILGLTHFGSYGANLVRRGLPYGTGRNVIWGCAAAFHASEVPALLRMGRWAESLGYWADDSLIAAHSLVTDRKWALTSRAIFDHLAFRSTLGHGARSRMYPQATIEDEGPHWYQLPAHGAVGTSVPDDAKDLAALWMAPPERAEGVVPTKKGLVRSDGSRMERSEL